MKSTVRVAFFNDDGTFSTISSRLFSRIFMERSEPHMEYAGKRVAYLTIICTASGKTLISVDKVYGAFAYFGKDGLIDNECEEHQDLQYALAEAIGETETLGVTASPAQDKLKRHQWQPMPKVIASIMQMLKPRIRLAES